VLVDSVGKLVQVGANRIEEPKDRAQPDVALAGLKTRQVGTARAHPLGDLLLREPGSLAELPQSPADGPLIWTCHTG
jgi:hypothetical protein